MLHEISRREETIGPMRQMGSQNEISGEVNMAP